MANELRDAFEAFVPDLWRREAGFSPEIAETQRMLFEGATTPSEVLSAWLQKYQPCFFGRVAAKQGLIRYCFLTESDLTSDELVRDKIQAARLAWTKAAFEGRASAFVLLFISPRLAAARPDTSVLKFATRLCSLYLREVDVAPDLRLHERVCLEKPGDDRVTWEWLAGVNYFCAHGDRRWWADHRIPGGMGFSVNSVGHLAQAGRIGEHMHALAKELGINESDFGGGTIRSLPDALKYAMLTIDGASDAVSGPATMLLNFPANDDSVPQCPVTLPRQLANKNHCAYAGWYHTDYTLPSEYFRADVTRPTEIRQHMLDFTYLFADDVNNPAHEAMALGHRIRATADDGVDMPASKRRQMEPIERAISDNSLLEQALGR